MHPISTDFLISLDIILQFNIKSKISIDRKGITKTRCYPIFYGDANKEGKDLIDALIRSLEGQELFHDIQNKVNN